MGEREIPKPAPTMWFVAFKFNRWANCETSVSIPFAAKMDDGSVGFMPVYETADDAAKANPGCIVKAVHALETCEEVGDENG